MSSYEDLSTRRLKRAYVRAVRGVWGAQKYLRVSVTPHLSREELNKALNYRDALKKELTHRGWFV